jgi:hypothetical protein
MRPSDWIYSVHNNNKITGFITHMDDLEVIVQVTIPSNYGTINLLVESVWLTDEHIWMDDIPTLIDLSLQIRDREWFEKWRHELSLWKPISEITIPKGA